MIKFFSPPLKYTRQGEPKPDSSGGAPLKPNQGIDRKTNAYPDGTDMKIGTHRKMIRGEPLAANETYTPLPGLTGVKNPEPFVIIESHLEGHSAKELCEHPMSLGPDFVSVTEKIMCDMETEKWWPLCDEGHTDLCFDLEKKVMRPASEATRQRLKRRGEVVPGVNVKEYSTHKVWKK
ncbi:hypothetical protein GQ43DRAFT_60948 [Delitschia confertaspora ATCC 74209]|uniref:Uncharacterized protein n=1 Tax=Delitschia confertaspora ATCC 74209 TaxID=1513339 RepID=A0A9P4JQJ0_9PLEO|nr:hypothetical protein GQ43DRAFT_60948 [Delitschia confertaspora ATCC 74209]